LWLGTVNTRGGTRKIVTGIVFTDFQQGRASKRRLIAAVLPGSRHKAEWARRNHED
jgi:hypothetical protein